MSERNVWGGVLHSLAAPRTADFRVEIFFRRQRHWAQNLNNMYMRDLFIYIKFYSTSWSRSSHGTMSEKYTKCFNFIFTQKNKH